MVNGIKKPHRYDLGDQDWKCFCNLCLELKVSTSKRVNYLINQDLIKNEDLVLKANDNQRQAIERRSKEKDQR